MSLSKRAVFYKDDFGHRTAVFSELDEHGDWYPADEVDAQIERLKSTAMKAAAGMAGAIHRAEDLQGTINVLREDCEISAKRAEKAEQELEQLRSQLAAREAEARSLGIQVQDLTNKLKSKDEQIEDHTAIGAALLDTLAKSYPGYSWCDCPTEVVCDLLNDIHDIKQAHADEIARLKSPPEERREIVERHAARLDFLRTHDYPLSSDPPGADIDALLQDCTRLRSAHAVLLVERDEARAACDKLMTDNAEYAKRHLAQVAEIERLHSEQPRHAAGVDEEVRFEIRAIRHDDSVWRDEDIEQASGIIRKLVTQRRYVLSALDRSAQECAGLRERLSSQDLTLAAYINRERDLVARLASHDACLAHLREEQELHQARKDLLIAAEARERRLREALQEGLRVVDEYANEFDEVTRWQDLTRELLAAQPAADGRQHTDDIAVDGFAAAMKSKLTKKRSEGKAGWDDPTVCTIEDLWSWLRNHVIKGDPVDVGNFAMMIWNRENSVDGVEGE